MAGNPIDDFLQEETTTGNPIDDFLAEEINPEVPMMGRATMGGNYDPNMGKARDIVNRVGRGAVEGVADIPRFAAIAGEYLDSKLGNIVTDNEDPTKTWLYGKGNQLNEFGDENLAVNKRFDEDFSSTLASGAGSLIPTIAATIMSGGAAAIPEAAAGLAALRQIGARQAIKNVGKKIVKLTPGAIPGTAQMGSQQTQEALQYGADPKAAARAGVLAALAGTPLEYLPLHGFTNIIGKGGEKLLGRIAGDAARVAAQEGTEEGLQQMASNYIARDYDPTRDIMAGVLPAAGAGAILGGGLGGGTSYLAGRGRGNAGPTDMPPPAAPAPNFPAAGSDVFLRNADNSLIKVRIDGLQNVPTSDGRAVPIVTYTTDDGKQLGLRADKFAAMWAQDQPVQPSLPERKGTVKPQQQNFDDVEPPAAASALLKEPGEGGQAMADDSLDDLWPGDMKPIYDEMYQPSPPRTAPLSQPPARPIVQAPTFDFNAEQRPAAPAEEPSVVQQLAGIEREIKVYSTGLKDLLNGGMKNRDERNRRLLKIDRLEKQRKVLLDQLNPQGAKNAEEPGDANLAPVEGENIQPSSQAAAALAELPLEQQTAIMDAMFRREDTTGDLAANLMRVDPRALNVDAKTFQFKGGGDQQGVTEKLRGVSDWDEYLGSNPITVWQRRDGKLFVADGHQRTGLAQRLISEGKQVPAMNAYVLRESEGFTPEDAMAQAARKNIAEGSASRLDVARLVNALKNKPEMQEFMDELRNTKTQNPRLVREGEALANLGKDALAMVANGVVDENLAVPVGQLVQDPNLQAQILKRWADSPPSSQQEAVDTVRNYLSEGTTDTGQTVDLFGTNNNLALNAEAKAKVKQRVAKELANNKRVFSTLVNNEQTITGVGNKLATDANVEGANKNARAYDILSKLSDRAGPVSEALKSAVAEQIANGRISNDTANRVIAAIQQQAQNPSGQNGQSDGRQESGVRTPESGAAADAGNGAENPAITAAKINREAAQITLQAAQISRGIGNEQQTAPAAAAQPRAETAPQGQQTNPAKPRTSRRKVVVPAGERVEIPGGKTGQVEKVNGAGAKKKYQVRLDSGASVMVKETPNGLATTEAPEAKGTPDPVVDMGGKGKHRVAEPTRPTDLLAAMDDQRIMAKKSLAELKSLEKKLGAGHSSGMAKKEMTALAQKVINLRKQMSERARDAAAYQKAWDDWAAKYPDQAKKAKDEYKPDYSMMAKTPEQPNARPTFSSLTNITRRFFDRGMVGQNLQRAVVNEARQNPRAREELKWSGAMIDAGLPGRPAISQNPTMMEPQAMASSMTAMTNPEFLTAQPSDDIDEHAFLVSKFTPARDTTPLAEVRIRPVLGDNGDLVAVMTIDENAQLMPQEKQAIFRRMSMWSMDNDFDAIAADDKGGLYKPFTDQFSKDAGKKDRVKGVALSQASFSREMFRFDFTPTVRNSYESIQPPFASNDDLVRTADPLMYDLMATPEGTVPRQMNFTAEAQALRPDILAKLAEATARMSPNAKMQLQDRLYVEGDPLTSMAVMSDYGALAMGRHSQGTITYAYSVIDDPASADAVAAHEAVHFLRFYQAITPQEWRTLTKNTDAWRKQFGLPDERQAREMGKLKDKVDEEAVAYAFQHYVLEKYKPGSQVQGIFNRMRNFFERLVNAMRGMGFNTPQDIFDSIYSGDVGARINMAEHDVGHDMLPFHRRTFSDDYSAVLASETPPQSDNDVLKAATDNYWTRSKIAPVRDFGRLVQYLNTPRYVATTQRDFAPVYRTARNQFQRFEEIINNSSELIAPYGRLPTADKAVVNKVLEAGRLLGQDFTDQGDNIVVRVPSDYTGQLAQPGDLIVLNEQQSDGYRAVRQTMDYQFEENKRVVLEKAGFENTGLDANGISSMITQEMIDAPARAESLQRELRRKDLSRAQRAEKEALYQRARMQASELAKLQKLQQILQSIEDAKRTGYVPFGRFGKYGVTVKNGEGVAVHFETMESPNSALEETFAPTASTAEAQEMIDKRIAELRGKYPSGQFTIEAGVISPKYLDDNKIDLGSIDELVMGTSISPELWERVKGEIADQLKMKGFRAHHARSRNVPGYSADLERAISQYITGSATFLSKWQYQEPMDNAFASIPDDKPVLKNYAKSYINYLRDNTEEWQGIRKLGFLAFLSTNVSSAAVNLTQPLVTTLPMLNMVTGNSATTAAEMTRALKDAIGAFNMADGSFDPSKLPADVREAATIAARNGVLKPQFSLELTGLSTASTDRGKAASKFYDNAVHYASVLFRNSEMLNRYITFIAAHRIATKPGAQQKFGNIMAGNQLWQSMNPLGPIGGFDPQAAAEFIVDETQFEMGKMNRPTVMRGVGAAWFQFKNFMLNMLEFQRKALSTYGSTRAAALNDEAARLGDMYVGQQMPDDVKQNIEALKSSASTAEADGRGMFMATNLMLMAFGGLLAFPFGENAAELVNFLVNQYREKVEHKPKVDLMAEATIGINRMMRTMVPDSWADLLTDGIMHGIPRPALGIDLSNRVGMGDLIPSDSAQDFLGVPFALAARPFEAIERWQKDQKEYALSLLLPEGVPGSILKAYGWKQRGIETINGSQVLAPEAVDNSMAIKKALGFTDSRVAQAREESRARQLGMTAVDEVKNNYTVNLANAYADRIRANNEGDQEAYNAANQRVTDLMAQLEETNRSLPRYEQIRIDPTTLRRRVQAEFQGKAIADFRRLPKQFRGRAIELMNLMPGGNNVQQSPPTPMQSLPVNPQPETPQTALQNAKNIIERGARQGMTRNEIMASAEFREMRRALFKKYRIDLNEQEIDMVLNQLDGTRGGANPEQ